MTDQIAPPGQATITRCGTCGSTGRLGAHECYSCGGTRWQLWRACPACGDIGYDRVGAGEYACRISCDYRWTEDHPGWQAQRLPDRLRRDSDGGSAVQG